MSCCLYLSLIMKNLDSTRKATILLHATENDTNVIQSFSIH